MLLSLHLVVGILVIVVTALSIASRPGRRIALYLITLQVILGIILIVQGLRAPNLHYGLALVGWAGLMVANRVQRKGERRLATAIAVASGMCLIVAFFQGYSSIKPA